MSDKYLFGELKKEINLQRKVEFMLSDTENFLSTIMGGMR